MPSKLKIAYYGNPILRQKASPIEEITDELRSLVEEMFILMEEKNGIGLAAPQVHHSIRLFITNVPILSEVQEKEDEESWDPGTPRVFINPKIISFSEEFEIRTEGCISIPRLYGHVERPFSVTVEATDLEGKLFKETYTGLEARCILHENDHINGKLYIDRISPEERKDLEKDLRAIKKKYSES